MAFFAVLRGEFYKKRLCSDVSLVIFEYLSKGTFKYSVAVLGRGWQGIHREPQCSGPIGSAGAFFTGVTCAQDGPWSLASFV